MDVQFNVFALHQLHNVDYAAVDSVFTFFQESVFLLVYILKHTIESFTTLHFIKTKKKYHSTLFQTLEFSSCLFANRTE